MGRMLKDDLSDGSNRGTEAINPAGDSAELLCVFKRQGPIKAVMTKTNRVIQTFPC